MIFAHFNCFFLLTYFCIRFLDVNSVRKNHLIATYLITPHRMCDLFLHFSYQNHFSYAWLRFSICTAKFRCYFDLWTLAEFNSIGLWAKSIIFDLKALYLFFYFSPYKCTCVLAKRFVVPMCHFGRFTLVSEVFFISFVHHAKAVH